MGDKRTYQRLIILRAVDNTMTTDWRSCPTSCCPDANR